MCRKIIYGLLTLSLLMLTSCSSFTSDIEITLSGEQPLTVELMNNDELIEKNVMLDTNFNQSLVDLINALDIDPKPIAELPIEEERLTITEDEQTYTIINEQFLFVDEQAYAINNFEKVAELKAALLMDQYDFRAYYFKVQENDYVEYIVLSYEDMVSNKELIWEQLPIRFENSALEDIDFEAFLANHGLTYPKLRNRRTQSAMIYSKTDPATLLKDKEVTLLGYDRPEEGSTFNKRQLFEKIIPLNGKVIAE